MNSNVSIHPSIQHVLQFFAHGHLPPHLQAVSKPFGDLAQRTADMAPNSPETTIAVRKLLEAKEAAVRAYLHSNAPPSPTPPE